MSENVEYQIKSYKEQLTLPNNSSYFTVEGNSIVTNKCSIALIGKNMPNYGEKQSENYLHLLQHFCSGKSVAPGVDEPAVKGQIWFEEVEGGSYNLNVCTQGGKDTDVKWDKIAHVLVNSIEPSKSTAQTGDLWYDTANKVLTVYDKSLEKWINIGPQDIIHKGYDSTNVLIPYNGEKQTFEINNSLYITTVKNSSEINPCGCCALMTSKIIMKENQNVETPTSFSTQRCKAIIAKYLVQSKDGITCKIIGSPSYEVIAQEDRENNSADDWTVNIGLNDLETKVVVTVNAKPYSGYYTVVECYTEVERV